MSPRRSVLLALLSAALVVPVGSGPFASAATMRSDSAWTYGGYTLRPPANPQAVDMPADVTSAAREVRQRAASRDRDITKQMIDIGNAAGATLKGLDFRIKSEQSIARKVAERAAETGNDPLTVAENLSDVTRYTMTFPTKQYTDAVMRTVRDLESEGNQLRIKNYWQQGDRYQGINIALTTPDGLKVELQLHTPSSLEAKEGEAHRLYEEFRESKDNDRRWALYKKMVRLAMRVPMPSWQVFSIGRLEFNAFDPLS